MMHLAQVGPHNGPECYMAHLSQATELTEKSPATRPLSLTTDDSLTKVGQRDLQVASKITVETRVAFFLQTKGRGCWGEGMHTYTSRTDRK